MNQKLKITFLPGSFDNFEGTQEELDLLVEELTNMLQSEIENGTLELEEIDTFDQPLTTRTLQ